MPEKIYIEPLKQLIRDAGVAVMGIYQQDFNIQHKADQSPVTEADLAAHRIISAGLKQLAPDLPVLSEESNPNDLTQRTSWTRYWLVDPLDGTKEFIKKNGEFTINIALIDQGRPVLGIVSAPALNRLYWGTGSEAFKQEGNGSPVAISVAPPPRQPKDWRVVGSRSHPSADFVRFMNRLPGAQTVAMGSSLKLCLVAEGKADLYPRLNPTSEWDTAAAHAVVIAAGGQVLELDTLIPLTYNSRPNTLINPCFVACAQHDSAWSDKSE